MVYALTESGGLMGDLVKTVKLGCLVLVGLLCVSTTASAQAVYGLVCAPGGAGSTGEAQERIDSFFSALEPLVGFKVEGEYHNTMAGCQAYMKRQSPSFGIFSIPVYLDWKKQKKLVVIGEVVREGDGEGRFYVVGKKGATLESLRGQPMLSRHWDLASFISSVAFQGEFNLADHFQGKKVSSGLRAIKKVAQGKAGAALLDHKEYSSLGSLPLPVELEALLTSHPVPGAPLVLIGKGAKIEVPLKKGLGRLCVVNKAACESIQLKQIRLVKPTHYRKVEKLSSGKR